jgi:hypothetical protein
MMSFFLKVKPNAMGAEILIGNNCGHTLAGWQWRRARSFKDMGMKRSNCWCTNHATGVFIAPFQENCPTLPARIWSSAEVSEHCKGETAADKA